MTERDDGIEEALLRYQPAGPPPGLRVRVLGPARGRPRPSRLAWLAAAAVLLAAVLLHREASGVHREVRAEVVASSTRERQAMIDDIASVLGGDDAARREAERIVMTAALDRETTMRAEMRLPDGAAR
jgi:hypothetical protein